MDRPVFPADANPRNSGGGNSSGNAPCTHAFCRSCITEWVERAPAGRKSCPQCRVAVREQDL
eukprot:3003661-Rhodomonas_salina.1